MKEILAHILWLFHKPEESEGYPKNAMETLLEQEH